MTRKDYELIARVFATTLPADSPWPAGVVFTEAGRRVASERRRVARAMADALAAESPRFNRAVFLAACKVPE